MTNFLEAENIYKNFDNFTALNDVSINIPQKSIFGLLGPNGAGKTTLIRIYLLYPSDAADHTQCCTLRGRCVMIHKLQTID